MLAKQNNIKKGNFVKVFRYFNYINFILLPLFKGNFSFILWLMKCCIFGVMVCCLLPLSIKIVLLPCNKGICKVKLAANITDSYLTIIINNHFSRNSFSNSGKVTPLRPILKKEMIEQI